MLNAVEDQHGQRRQQPEQIHAIHLNGGIDDPLDHGGYFS